MTGYRFYPEGTTGQFLGDTVQWLIVSTFHPDTGKLAENNLFQLMPNGLTADFSGVRSFAGREDETFAVGYDYAENNKLPPRASLGRLGDTDVLKTVLLPATPDPSVIALQTAAAWDGEAFALHAYGAPPQFTLHVGRMNDQASVILPLTQFGQTASAATPGYVLGHRTSTNATSGRTFVFDSDVVQVNVHDRAGAALPFSPVVLQPPGAPQSGFSTGAVSADDFGGAWFVYTWIAQLDRAIEIVHMDDKGGIDKYFESRPPKSDIGYFKVHAMTARKESALIASATFYGVYTLTVDASGVSEPTLVVQGLDTEHDLRDMELIDFGGETWLSYSENASNPYLRVLKLSPGCVYPASTPSAK
ncbi:MAG: hypothetical protein IPI67_23445 [Myxococcales bacterium]|nr:hypothetical protein [Myxococcales bacterium]